LSLCRTARGSEQRRRASTGVGEGPAALAQPQRRYRATRGAAVRHKEARTRVGTSNLSPCERRATRSPVAKRQSPANNVSYLLSLSLDESRVDDWDTHPFDLPFVKGLRLKFNAPLTFFVGENGSGKSTLLQAIADLCRLPISGGGRSELADFPGVERARSRLASALRPAFRQQPWDGYFVRAENLGRLADLLESREEDPDFLGDAYFSYGGRSLHTRSHGEAFLALFEHRLQAGGVLVMDEPEAALSPQRQLTLLALLHAFVESGNTQLFIATHSPILLTFPGATLLAIDNGRIVETRLEDTSHYQITRGILECPERYWKHLKSEPEDPDDL
jgi:predicted ATPase